MSSGADKSTRRTPRWWVKFESVACRKLYREWIIDSREDLRDDERRSDSMTAIRSMVDKIVLTPDGETLTIVLKGDLAVMLAAASPKAEAEDLQRQVKWVAGAGTGKVCINPHA